MEDDSDTNFIGWQFLLIVFLMNIIESISIYESLYFVKHLGFSYITIGIIFGLAAFLRFLFEIPIGIFGDSYGNKKNVLIGIFLVFLGYLFILLSKLETVLLGVILIAIGDAFWISSLNASAIEFLKFNGYNNFTKFFSFKAFFVSLGYILGLLINIFIIKTFNIKFIFLFGIILLFIIFIIALFIPSVKLTKQKKSKFNFDFKIFLLNKFLFKISILTFLIALAMEGIHNYIYLFFSDRVGDDNVGFIAILEVLGSLVAPFILLKILIKMKLNLFSISLFITFISILLLAYINHDVLKIISFIIFNIFLHIYYILKDNLLHENIYSNRATAESILNTIESFGEIIGGLIIAIIINFFGFKTGLLAISILFLFSFIVSILNFQKIYGKNKINL